MKIYVEKTEYINIIIIVEQAESFCYRGTRKLKTKSNNYFYELKAILKKLIILIDSRTKASGTKYHQIRVQRIQEKKINRKIQDRSQMKFVLYFAS